MKKWFKGLMSLVLALVLVFGLMPSKSFAEPVDQGAGGGTVGKAYYQVEWLPEWVGKELVGLQMHLYRTNDGQDFYGPQCRDGNRVIMSEGAGYVPMNPDLGGCTLDECLTKAEQLGYNGDEKRNQLDFDNVDNPNGCYAKWTEEVEDGHIGEYAIYVTLKKRPQGTWGYFCDTNDSGGHDNPPDKTELDIPAGETRVLTDGYWQAHWEKRGDSDWMDYAERDDIGDTNWAAAKEDGTFITNTEVLVPGTVVTVNGYITQKLKDSIGNYGGSYWLGFKKVTGRWGYWIDTNKNGHFDDDEPHDVENKAQGQTLSIPAGKYRVVSLYRDGSWRDYCKNTDYSADNTSISPFNSTALIAGFVETTKEIESNDILNGGDKIKLAPYANQLLSETPIPYGGKLYIGLVPADDKFTVVYDLDGGKPKAGCTHNYEDQETDVDGVSFSELIAYEAPEKIVNGKSLKFKGWQIQNGNVTEKKYPSDPFDAGGTGENQVIYSYPDDIEPMGTIKSMNPGVLYLKADWEENIFRVTYDLNGGVGDDTTQEALVDGITWSEITTHKAPTKINQNGEPSQFKGWRVMQDFFAGYEDIEEGHEPEEHAHEHEGEEGEKMVDAIEVKYEKDQPPIEAGTIVKSKLPGTLPLQAVWDDTFRVEYDLNGGVGDDSPQEDKIIEGQWTSFNAHAAPTKEVPGMVVTFIGWEVQNEKPFDAGEELAYVKEQIIKAAEEIKSKNPGVLYLKAKYEEIPDGGSPIEYWGDGASEGEVEPETIPEDIKYYDNTVYLGQTDNVIEKLQEQVIDLKQDTGRGSLFDRILRSYEYNNLGAGDTGTPDSYDEQESKFKGWVWEGSSDTTPRQHLKDWTSMAWRGYETYYVEREVTVDRTRRYCDCGCSVSYSATQITYDKKRVYVTYLPGTQGWINHVFFDEAAIEQKEAEMKAKADQIVAVDRAIAYGDLNIPGCGCYTACGRYSCWHVHRHTGMSSYSSSRSAHLSQRRQYQIELSKLMTERDKLMKTWNGKIIRFRARWYPDYDTTDFAEKNGSLARKQVGSDVPDFMEGKGTDLGGKTSEYHQMGWYDAATNGNRVTGNKVSLTLGEGKKFELENNGAYNSALPTTRTKTVDDNTLFDKPMRAGKAVPVKGNPNNPYLWYAHWYSITSYDTVTGLKNLFNGYASRTTRLYKDGKSYVTVTMTNPNIPGLTRVNIVMNDDKDKGYVGDAKQDFMDIVYQNDSMEKNVTRYPTIYYDGTDVSNSIIFLGWNTEADGSGNWYGSSLSDGSKGTPVGRGDGKFTLGGPDVTLYAVYKLDFNLIYDRNDQHDEPAYTMAGGTLDAKGHYSQTDRIADNMFTVNSTDIIKFRTNDDHKKDSELGADYTNFLMLGYDPAYWDDNLKEIKKKYRPYSWQGWSLDNKAYFQDNKVYHCMNSLRTNIDTLMQVNPSAKSDIDIVNIRDWLAECFTWNPMDNIEIKPDGTFSVRTYSVWDEYPDIWAYDVTYTKQLVDNYLDHDNLEGFIELVFYDCLYQNTDKEDDPRNYIDKVEIGGIVEDDLRIDDYGSTTAEVKVTDTAGNVTVYPIRIYIFSDQLGTTKETIDDHPDVDDPTTAKIEHYYDDSRYQAKVFSRFIDELNYSKMNGDKPATEDGALMEYSKWYTNKERAEQIQRAFERMKSGTYAGYKSSYIYTIEDLQKIQEDVKKNGIGKTSRPDLWDETIKWLFSDDKKANKDIEPENNNTIGFKLNKEQQLRKLQENSLYELGE